MQLLGGHLLKWIMETRKPTREFNPYRRGNAASRGASRRRSARSPNSRAAFCRKLFRISREEYRAARENVAIFDTNWHAIFRLSGRDRVRYLHAITSNDIKGLAEGYGVLALLLNPQGHILAELEVYALKETLAGAVARIRARTHVCDSEEIYSRLASATRRPHRANWEALPSRARTPQA